ncbi:MAG: hypothetical protein HZA13_01450 [Nitrospirae bacterium]|nr:hypothetical protein [Nitrospirota bacterium]
MPTGGGDLKPASKASVEGETPSGSAGGGGDASPLNRYEEQAREGNQELAS